MATVIRFRAARPDAVKPQPSFQQASEQALAEWLTKQPPRPDRRVNEEDASRKPRFDLD